MDDRLIYAVIGGGIVYTLYMIEQRLRSFENRMVMGINAQTTLMREEVAYEIVWYDDEEDDEPSPQ